MSTINISLPQEQVIIIDRFIRNYGFANRSEFIRSLIRYITYGTKRINKTVSYPFISPPKTTKKEVLKEFVKTKKYSNKFIKDLKDGLKNTDYFN